MNTSQRERGLFNYLDGQAENGSIQENQINHSQTSENMSGDENSGHGETPNTPKSYETQKLTIINEHTQKERTNYTTIGNVFSIGNDLSHHSREIKFLGKKTSEPSIADNELDMEQVSETVIDALTNNIQFLKDLSSKFYGYNLDFKINKDLIKQKDFIEKNLDKTFKALLLMMMEDIGPQEKEMVKNEIKTILDLELKLKDIFLPFCRTIFNMNLKNLLLFYINDRNDKLNNFKLKTLEDNPKNSDEEKIGIRKQILSYLKSQKELTSSINDHEMPFNLPTLNLFQLPINDINEENLSPEKIDSVHHIEKNQEGNHIENNETENHIKNNQSQNHNNLIAETLEPNETSQKLDDKTNRKPKGVYKFNNCKLKTLKDNTNYIENEKEQIKKMILNYMNSLKESNSKNACFELDIPQPPSNLNSLSNNEDLGNYNIKKFISIEKNENKNENIIKSQDNQEKDEEQEYSNKKTENKTDDEKGKRLENLVRSTVKKNYLFVVKEIEKILVKMNKKIKRVSIYNDITKNSTEHFKVIFDEQISSILKRKMENQKVIDDILNDNGNSDELTTLKELLTMSILDIINKFIKDETLILKNGTKIKINILGLETTETQKKISERIKDNMKIIKDKLKEIVECEKGRIREKSPNNQN